MTNNFKIKKAFSLLEILISSTIFALIMIMTTATIAQSSSYKNKLRAQREVSEDSRRLADQITRDVRNSTEKATIQIGSTTKTFKNGLALLNCHTGSCSFVNDTSLSNDIDYGNFFSSPFSFSYNANVLVATTKDGYRVYMTVKNSINSSGVYYKLFSGTSKLTSNDIVSMNVPNQITSANNETVVNFGGFAPNDALALGSSQQPFIQFYITSRTKDFDNLSTSERALTQIKSSVTSRSYNN